VSRVERVIAAATFEYRQQVTGYQHPRVLAYHGLLGLGDAGPFCMAFLVWIFRGAGCPPDQFPQTASVSTMIDQLPKPGMGRELLVAEQIKPGDIWLTSRGQYRHGGLIVGLADDPGYFHAIEGNTEMPREGRVRCVGARIRSWTVAEHVMRPAWLEE
jgi:ribosomal protein L27